MRMLNCDSVRELALHGYLSVCGDSGSPDFSELALANIGAMEGDVFGESSIRRRARRAAQDGFIPIDELTDEDILDSDFFSFDEEEEEIKDVNDDSTPYDYDEEEEDLSFATAIATPKVEVFINTNPDTGAVSVSTEEDEPYTDTIGLREDYDSSYDDRMECLGDYDDWTGPCDDDVVSERSNRFLDDDDDYDYEYEDEWSRPSKPTGMDRKSRIGRKVWEMEEELDEHDPFEDMQDKMKLADARQIRNRWRSDRGADRTDLRYRKNVGGKLILPDGEVPIRYLPSRRSHNLALAIAGEEQARAKMIKDWAANRQVYINSHGWMYWSHPIIDSFGRVRSNRQGARLTGEEYRFFMSLSRGERNHYLHPKCRNYEWVGTDYEGGRSVSRPNSWKHQRKQTRQWENPTMRRSGKKVVQTTPEVEMDTFDRVILDRIAILKTQIEIEEAKEKPDVESMLEMKSALRSLYHASDCWWGEERDDMLEIFWRVRNDGHVPMAVQERIVEKYGANGLIDFLVIAGLSSNEAYEMEDEREEAMRRVA